MANGNGCTIVRIRGSEIELEMEVGTLAYGIRVKYTSQAVPRAADFAVVVVLPEVPASM